MGKEKQSKQSCGALMREEGVQLQQTNEQPVWQGELVKHEGKLPDETLKDLTPEMKRQYFIWDEIFKREIELHPQMLFPLIKEIFEKEYPVGTNIVMLSTEYVVSKIYGQGERLIESIHSDLLVQVGSRDIYHIECQMKESGNMAFRMLEYDMNIALTHGKKFFTANKGTGNQYKLKFPQSVILYLNNTRNTPDMESCCVEGPDGKEHIYSVPVMKVQEYTPEMVLDKHLDLLFPFLPIRFLNRFNAIVKEKNSENTTAESFKKVSGRLETLKNDLTKFMTECIIIINREEENGTLEQKAVSDLLEFMGKACDHLFGKEPELLKEVHEVMEPVIKLVREELEEQIEKQKGQIEEQNEQLEEQKGQLKEQSKQLTQHIANYIQQCREEGRSRDETEHLLQKIFSLDLADARKLLG